MKDNNLIVMANLGVIVLALGYILLLLLCYMTDGIEDEKGTMIIGVFVSISLLTIVSSIFCYYEYFRDYHKYIYFNGLRRREG